MSDERETSVCLRLLAKEVLPQVFEELKQSQGMVPLAGSVRTNA